MGEEHCVKEMRVDEREKLVEKEGKSYCKRKQMEKK